MTMAISWTRSINNTEEMIVATDSRLRFGCQWDCCPKIMILPRNDSVIAFSGDTMYSYPIIIQAVNLINMHFKLRTRGMSLTDFKGHLIRVLNDMTSQITDKADDEDIPDTEFILSGYCCHSSAYKSWLIHYDVSLNNFTFRPTSKWSGGNNKKMLTFTGDYKDEFKNRLVELLKSKNVHNCQGFDMEPFEVLRDMILEDNKPLIGGSPQIVKIYKNINCLPFGVFWPNKETGAINLFGRPLLDYEKHSYLNIDPVSLEVTK